LLAGVSPSPAPAGTAPPRDRLLITPAALERQLSDRHIVLLHIGQRAEYDAGHIPGARYFDFDWIDGGTHEGLSLELPPIASLDSVFGSLGVGPDSRVVIYFGQDWVSIATRVWFTLDYMGLAGHAVILDGGLPAWRAAGLPVSTDSPAAATPSSLASRAHPEVVAQADWIRDHLDDAHVAVLDARAPAFYKGLEVGMHPRVGHLPGARNLYFESVVKEDLRFQSDSALRRLFREADAGPGKQIVAYCHVGQQATAVFFAARLLGYSVKLYDGSFQEWSARPELPLEGGVPFTQGRLVSTEELASMLQQGSVTVIDARSDLPAYLANHLPGAAFLHYETLRASRRGVPGDTLSPEGYAGLLGRLGIRRDRPVVVYGTGDAANFNATFLIWLLTGFRQPQVYLLDGGYGKWSAEGRPLSRKYPTGDPTTYAADPYALEVANVEWVQYMVNKPSGVIVDVRPPDQYAGSAGAQLRRGHIPGAVNHFWQDDLRDAGGTKIWKSVNELRASYERQGITPDKQVFLYCNTGTEASHVYFALRHLLGYPRVRIYVPSWTEWSEKEELPVEAGQAAGR